MFIYDYKMYKPEIIERNKRRLEIFITDKLRSVKVCKIVTCRARRRAAGLCDHRDVVRFSSTGR